MTAPLSGRGDLAGIQSLLPLSGAHPWTNASIRHHMKTEAAKLPGNFWWLLEHKLGGISIENWNKMADLFGIALRAFAMSTLCFAFIGLIVSMATLPAKDKSFAMLLLTALGVIMAISLTGVLVFTLLRNVKVLPPAKWNYYPWDPRFNGAANVIVGTRIALIDPPEVARAMAKKLLALAPDTTFIVAKLERTGHTGIFDPVLFAVAKEAANGEKKLRPMCAWNPDKSIVDPPAA